MTADPVAVKRRDDFPEFNELRDAPFAKVIAELAPSAPDPLGLSVAAHYALDLPGQRKPLWNVIDQLQAVVRGVLFDEDADRLLESPNQREREIVARLAKAFRELSGCRFDGADAGSARSALLLFIWIFCHQNGVDVPLTDDALFRWIRD